MEEVTYKNREEMVYQVLKKEILDLELKPGQLIKETEICERFSVSRTPVRDALRLLQEQGFVITVPYRGIYVTLLSLSNIKQMIYMRVAVETMVLRDFMEIQTPMVMEEIRHAIAVQKALIQTPGFEPEQFYRMDAQMHSLWFTAVKRQKLWDMLQAQQLHGFGISLFQKELGRCKCGVCPLPGYIPLRLREYGGKLLHLHFKIRSIDKQ